MQNFGVSSQTSSTFTLEIPVAKGGGVGGGVSKLSVGLPKPRTPTTIDSWALVVD